MTKLVWIDPPSGWRYGFPKLYDREKYPDSTQWLLDNGYPQGIIDKFPDGLICSFNTPSDEEVIEFFNQVENET